MTPKRRRFVDEYLVDGNATKAAERAGFSKKTAPAAGSRLLRNVEVAQAIAAGQASRAERVQVTQDEVLVELKAIGLVALEDDEAEKDEETGRVVVRRATIRPEHKLKALELLAKHLGMLKEKVEHTGADGAALTIEVRKLGKDT